MKITQTSRLRLSGMAMRAVAGICRIGRTPGMLQRRMKTKRLMRNGVQRSPARPIVGITI